ncbi:MAG: hypothetical protein ACI4D4_06060 [Lachnospira sp.]
MFTMKFEFDEEKLKKNDPDLNIEQCYQWLDEICTDTRFTKTSLGEYVLNDGEDEIGSLLVLIGRFEQQSWLYSNLKSWKTFDDEEGEQDALKVVLKD